ncbi:MAG: hypothetical protein QF619_08225 [Candidatus Binatia bacterium]|nr:hypothetical protein [Candidatus Binatia bacterium]
MIELLAAIYGKCRVSHSFPWPTQPTHYNGTAVGVALDRIYDGLRQLRGHRNFTRTEQMPPCDYYLPGPNFILEFDESQHFTRPRLVALSLYPPELKVGFSIGRWIDLCRRIEAKDDEPFDRDERRAWYDTLRDLIPTLHGLKPTVRLYSDDFQWCSLRSDSVEDQKTFQSFLRGA